MRRTLGTSTVFAGILAIFGSPGAFASLTTFQVFNGTVGVSTDGIGFTGNSGSIRASVPLGATVVAAYLYTDYNNGGSTAGSALAGTTVSYGPTVDNGTACCTLGSRRADVTSIVKPLIDGGPGGTYTFSVTETATGNQDGEALVVVYNDPTLGVSTVGILDGWASVTGDMASLNFASPLHPAAPGFGAEMRLGIGFSCGLPENCTTIQSSIVAVNGTVITNNAGNHDDCPGPASNGCLITVGGFDDPFSPLLPTYAADHERYSLVNQIHDGDTSISINTSNASQDDNIFLAVFDVSGIATVTVGTPEPSTWLLLGTALCGLGAMRLRRKS